MFNPKPTMTRFAKEILHRSPFRKYFFPRFLYNFTPPQLCFLCECLENTRDVNGAVAEIGCSDGSTTLFLGKYLQAQDIRKTYFAVDTFSGFVADDIEFEVANRGKSADLYNGFRSNKKTWFDKTMLDHGVAVRSIKADVNKVDLTTLGPLSFVLLDVDLYRPIRKALFELYQVLSPHGIIVVDDCNAADIRWDGADQAYKEFIVEIGKPVEIIHNKLGIIRKNM